MTPRPYATAQLIGGREEQCDATGVFSRDGVRAYVLLDGIGDTLLVRLFARHIARKVAYAAAVTGDPAAALMTVNEFVVETDRTSMRPEDRPSGVAVVAVAQEGRPLQVAWCGDARAYVLEDWTLTKLTTDHNARQELLDAGTTPCLDDRHLVTQWLGKPDLVVESATGPSSGRLLLASDGAYEPLEDSCRDLRQYLGGTVQRAAREFVEMAIEHASATPDNATALVADF